MSTVALFIIATHIQTSKSKENPNEIKTKRICKLWYVHKYQSAPHKNMADSYRKAWCNCALISSLRR